MTLKFDAYVEQLKSLLDQLKAAPFMNLRELKQFPEASGCYALTEDSKYLYVGIARNFRQRMRNHTSGRAEQSAFAFKLARELTGRKTEYTKAGSRKALMQDPIFVEAMKSTTSRVRSMRAQIVQIEDPSQRYLFEFFAALSLEAPYNDFNTH
ncbi:MAG: GIY-YIG nuclease family protein [Xanthobacteraceae bacterium]|nr:GIY-YIG nuclease family protein [Xanthobacteraceae bacterium]